MSYDAIQLIASLKDQPSHSSDLLVEYVLEINGQAIHEEFWVDLFELAKSCQLDGEFAVGAGSDGDGTEQIDRVRIGASPIAQRTQAV